MPKARKPTTYDEWVARLPPGVEDRPAVWRGAEHEAQTLAALEEYERTGISYSIEEAAAQLKRLVAERRARKA